MSSLFKVPIKKQRKNTFDLSHGLKASGKMGRIIPVLALDCMPGDELRIGVKNLFRFLPMVAAVMHFVRIKTSFYFVPNRILCPTWETFILAEEEGQEPVAPPTILWQPTDQLAGFTVGGYMGLPGLPSGSNYIEVSAYPFAAYHSIYENYYRPQHLESAEPQELTPGNTNSWALEIAQGVPISTNWALDYFTSALPYPQWGSEAVRIPVGGQTVIYQDINAPGMMRDATTGLPQPGTGNVAINLELGSGYFADESSGDPLAYDPNGTLITDPNSAGTMDDLLRANALQRWLRKTAVAGNRYFEQIRAHFGTPVQDARLQRPEFIGTVKQTVSFSPVLSTAETDAPLAQIAGEGTSSVDSPLLKYYAKEHGWVIGLLTVMPSAAYQDGVARKWLRKDKFDYPWPDFANIGEQPVYNAEIYADLPLGSDTGGQFATWGYQSRYAELKVENDRVAGLMRGELDFWHLGRKFQDLPTLSKLFVQTSGDQATFARIFADLEGEHFVFQSFFKISASRPLPRFGIPAL